MGVFNAHEAKAHFSSLLDRVAQGEEVIIAKSGRLAPGFYAFTGGWHGHQPICTERHCGTRPRL